jgi:CubicO group peptidase (beta-lactamase class C family)
MNSYKVQRIVSAAVKGNSISGVVLAVEHQEKMEVFSAGDFKKDEPYFIASTTKLYTTASIFILRKEGLISLDDTLCKWFDKNFLKGLHILNGVEYGEGITIKHLLTHTSGLPDYFQHKKENGKSLLEELQVGIDQSWSFDDAIALTKKMKPAFVPGTDRKALYSDSNFQLLGRIIELTTGDSVEAFFEKSLFAPLNLKLTYMFNGKTAVKKIRFKSVDLHIPKAMASFRADGGIVSTASESLIFLKAFFSGFFFPKEYLKETHEWNRVMYPIEYGIGYMRFKLPRIFTLFKRVPLIYGHSGLSGAFEFYCPEKELYLSGSVNQIHSPATSFRMIMKVLMSV